MNVVNMGEILVAAANLIEALKPVLIDSIQVETGTSKYMHVHFTLAPAIVRLEALLNDNADQVTDINDVPAARKLLTDFFMDYPHDEEQEKLNATIMGSSMTKLVTELINQVRINKAAIEGYNQFIRKEETIDSGTSSDGKET